MFFNLIKYDNSVQDIFTRVNLAVMSTSIRSRKLKALDRRMNAFHVDGSNLINDVSCLTEKYDTLGEKLNRLNGNYVTSFVYSN